MELRTSPADPAADPSRQEAGWRARLTGGGAVAVVLALFWIVMAASLRHKSLTYDEVAHAAAGYSYWHYSDYRLQPENGQLPQRLAGLPMALSVLPFPDPDPTVWRNAQQWQAGYRWLFRSGRDAAALAGEGRMLCGLFAVGLGALVWGWSRRLFGPAAGMVSLLLYVLNPTVLANGALMTSDAAAAFFFLAAAGCMSALLDRLTLGRLLLSAGITGALFLSKLSAFLVIPVALLLVAGRLGLGGVLPVSILGYRRDVGARARQLLFFCGAAVVHLLLAALLIWAAYGFRYSAFAAAGGAAGRFRIPWEKLLGQPEPGAALASLDLDTERRSQVRAVLAVDGAGPDSWSNATLDALAVIRRDVLTRDESRRLDAALAAPSTERWVQMMTAARRLRLLPEAYLYGIADVYRRSQVRPAFLNGEFRLRGWPGFFPYTFLVKTPLALFAVMALALAAVRWRGLLGWASFYPMLPLWALMGVYGAASLASHLNIGHRHLLPVYGPLLILCGVAARWWETAQRGRALGSVSVAGRVAAASLLLLLVGLTVETVGFFPNYLAYFNGVVSPRQAYRHLVDSSLDWGQELPAVREFLDREKNAVPAYFSYFGASSPEYYGIRASALYSVAGLDGERRPDWKNLFLLADAAATSLPSLRQEWADYDLLGTQRMGDSVAVTFLRTPERLALHGGTYLISASMLQPVNFELDGPWGPWTEAYETAYQGLDQTVRPLTLGDRAARIATLRRHPLGEWPVLLQRFEEYRFARLTAYLRDRRPDEEINFSILVYRLTEAELKQALEGPHPRYGPAARSWELLNLSSAGPPTGP